MSCEPLFCPLGFWQTHSVNVVIVMGLALVVLGVLGVFGVQKN
eukprot:COSAG03_NODE_24421_length_272_cov_0.884393_2_plen_42_part_01